MPRGQYLAEGVKDAIWVLRAEGVSEAEIGRRLAIIDAAQRVGFTLEGHLRENELIKGAWTDELVYGMLATEWPADAHRAAGVAADPPVP